MKYLRNLSKKEIFGKTCLLRVDLNIQDTDLNRLNTELHRKNFRISLRSVRISPRLVGILPTIKFLTDNGAKVVILSHRGRPQKILSSKYQVSSYTLKPFAKILSRLLKKSVRFINFNKNWKEINTLINKSKDNIFLLENLRFLASEEKNDLKLAKQLASLGDFYINDAFAVSHRNAASISAIAKFLPSYAGLLLEKEINNLDEIIKNYKKPFIVILGGAKISDKIGLIENFKNKADYFLIGGGIAHNFLLARGLPIGDSIFEEKTIGFAKKMLNDKRIILPVDYAIENRKILDIGPNTVKMYSDVIKKAKTIIWNGPMGYFENKKFAKGSEGIVKAIINNKKAFSVIGGGETTLLFNLQPTTDNKQQNLFISTGGGAMLEYLAGEKLPGIKILK